MEIHFRGFEELERKLGRVAAGEWITAGLLAAGIYIKGKIAKYPPSRHAPQPFVSDKQRRGFFAKLAEGLIEVPYRRGQSPGSERLGQSWTAQARDQGRTVVIGNDASYGRLVQDKDVQTGYHRVTGWPTAQDVVEREKREVTEALARELRKALRS